MSGTYLVIDEGPSKALTIACHHGWWKMVRTDIQRFSQLQGVHISNSASLFDTLLGSIMGILKCDEEAAMVFMGKRLVREKRGTFFAEEVLQLDEAIDLFDYNDREAVKGDIKKAGKNLDSFNDFVVELSTKRSEMAAAKKQRQDQNRPKVPRVLSQEEAAIYCPPNGHIWINNQCRKFHGHLEKSEYKRVFASYPEDGVEHEAYAEPV